MILRTYSISIAFAVLIATAQVCSAQPVLLPNDITTIIQQAVAATPAGVNAVIAVSDREGFILAVYGVNGAPLPTGLTRINAIDKAGTAAYLSSNGEAFTSRTAGFIIQPHFPPGIANTGTGPLTGVGLSSLPFSDINHFRSPLAPALGIANTSLSGNPGGVPLYKNGVLVGGVGVDSNTFLSALVYVGGPDVDENIAVSAQAGYGAPASILATQVLLNGIRLPYTDASAGGSGTLPALVTANFDPTFPSPPALVASTGLPFATFPNPFATQFPGSEVRNPIVGSALGSIMGQPRLSVTEVQTILGQAALRASQTRGAIRNPIGPAEVFIVVIDYYNGTAAPNAPAVLGSLRTPDATIFSYDVAAQKARTALFFSTNATASQPIALSTRAVGFLAEGTYPPGIDGTESGPYGPPTYGPSNSTGPLFSPPFGIQSAVSILPTGIPLIPINGYLPNGITIFPGGYPLYRNGVLIGAVGVSGDGVDQDDLIGAAATVGFEAPTNIRSDEYSYRGARLPYAKFPQNASL